MASAPNLWSPWNETAYSNKRTPQGAASSLHEPCCFWMFLGGTKVVTRHSECVCWTSIFPQLPPQDHLGKWNHSTSSLVMFSCLAFPKGLLDPFCIIEHILFGRVLKDSVLQRAVSNHSPPCQNELKMIPPGCPTSVFSSSGIPVHRKPYQQPQQHPGPLSAPPRSWNRWTPFFETFVSTSRWWCPFLTYHALSNLSKTKSPRKMDSSTHTSNVKTLKPLPMLPNASNTPRLLPPAPAPLHHWPWPAAIPHPQLQLSAEGLPVAGGAWGWTPFGEKSLECFWSLKMKCLEPGEVKESKKLGKWENGRVIPAMRSKRRFTFGAMGERRTLLNLAPILSFHLTKQKQHTSHRHDLKHQWQLVECVRT